MAMNEQLESQLNMRTIHRDILSAALAYNEMLAKAGRRPSDGFVIPLYGRRDDLEGTEFLVIPIYKRKGRVPGPLKMVSSLPIVIHVSRQWHWLYELGGVDLGLWEYGNTESLQHALEGPNGELFESSPLFKEYASRVLGHIIYVSWA